MHLAESFNSFIEVKETLDHPLSTCLVELVDDLMLEEEDDYLMEEFISLCEQVIFHSEGLNEADASAGHQSDAIVKGASTFWLGGLVGNELKKRFGATFAEVGKTMKSGAKKAGDVITKKGKTLGKGVGKLGAKAARNPRAAVALAAAAIITGSAIKIYRSKVKKRLAAQERAKAETDKSKRDLLLSKVAQLKAEEQKFKEETKEKVDKAKDRAVEIVKENPKKAAAIINKGKAAANRIP